MRVAGCSDPRFAEIAGFFRHGREIGVEMPPAAVSGVLNSGIGMSSRRLSDEGTSAAEKEGARTVGRVLRLFELLATENSALRLTDIARELKVPLSSAHALLHQLLKFNYVGVVEDRRYAKGMALMRLGSRILGGIDLVQIGYPVLQRLSEITGESVYLGMRHANGIAYIRSVEAMSGIVLRAPLGVPRPLHASSVGRVFLAYGITPGQLDAMLGSGPLRAFTSKTVTDRAALKRVLDETRQLGYSISSQQMQERATSISAPIFGMNDSLVGTISLGADIGRFKKSKDLIVSSVVSAAAEVSRNMGVENWSAAVEFYRSQPAFGENESRASRKSKRTRAIDGEQ
jgi:DNA-binding IclR family transcriptional regulator